MNQAPNAEVWSLSTFLITALSQNLDVSLVESYVVTFIRKKIFLDLVFKSRFDMVQFITSTFITKTMPTGDSVWKIFSSPKKFKNSVLIDTILN